jgi:3-phosphoshikimate 1-carboxyvinyltransferase
MKTRIQIDQKIINGALQLSGSKSISNRLLIIQALSGSINSIHNCSTSEDTCVLQKALSSNSSIIDIGLAGTAMRFLSAYYASRKSDVILTGSTRMKQRPIGVLVDALRLLGADISYTEKEGFPPLKIKGKPLEGGVVSMNASVSSQFITALLLISPSLKKGIQIQLSSDILSKPYIDMTLTLMKQQGVTSTWEGNRIIVPSGTYKNEIIEVESDWSSISYLFEIMALSSAGEIMVSKVDEISVQGDQKVMEFYKLFGVESSIEKGVLKLRKVEGFVQEEKIEIDCKGTPDIAQTLAATACGLGVAIKLTGLNNLPLKETNRLLALKIELEKCGAEVVITNNETLEVFPLKEFPKIDLEFETYHDHRMAMCLAPLALKAKSVLIDDIEVVNKSYKTYWEDLEKLSFNLHLQDI